jgi:hypothetical protein
MFDCACSSAFRPLIKCLVRGPESRHDDAGTRVVSGISALINLPSMHRETVHLRTHHCCPAVFALKDIVRRDRSKWMICTNMYVGTRLPPFVTVHEAHALIHCPMNRINGVLRSSNPRRMTPSCFRAIADRASRSFIDVALHRGLGILHMQDEWSIVHVAIVNRDCANLFRDEFG